MVVKIQVVIFWLLRLCSDVGGYHCFRGYCYLHLLQDEDGGHMILRNVGILTHHYTVSRSRRPKLEQ